MAQSSVVSILQNKEIIDTSAGYTEIRPWGSFTVLDQGCGYKVKRIEVNPGHRLSLQKHLHRSENWIITSGSGIVVCGEKKEKVSARDYMYIPAEEFHRLENIGLVPLIVIEIQCGNYLEEDDIIRIQDDYRRK